MSKFARRVLITGATDGIGLETAKELAKDAKNFVVIHGRSKEKCENALSQIRTASRSDPGASDFVVADLSDLSQVDEMSKVVLEKFHDLNVLICNAGVKPPPQRQLTKDGLELAFQVNHLSQFLLINRLLPVLRQNVPSRLVVVSSALYSRHPLDLDDLQIERGYDVYTQYSRTKLMNHLTTFKLARTEGNQGIAINCLHPGVIDTKLLRASASIVGQPVKNGIIASIFLATDPGATFSEKYVNEEAEVVAEPAECSRNEEDQDRLWELSTKLLRERGFEL